MGYAQLVKRVSFVQRFLFLALAALAILAMPSAALCADFVWDNGAGNNDWFVAQNWNPDLTPSSSNILLVNAGSPMTTGTVYISNGGRLTLTGSGVNALLKSLSIGDSETGGLDVLSGARLSGTNLFVGGHGDGALQIISGGVLTDSSGYLGYHAGSMGVGTISGAGSRWGNSAKLYLGYGGSGTLRIEAGGIVSNTSSTGNTTYLGYQAGSTGVVTVTGAGSQLTCSGGLDVGHDGNGTLIVEDGATVTGGWGYVGYGQGSSGAVAVSGTGSTWASTYSVYVGYRGDGSVKIADGATASSAENTYIGEVATGAGSLEIIDAKWTTRRRSLRR